jgi:hypothetical protein
VCLPACLKHRCGAHDPLRKVKSATEAAEVYRLQVIPHTVIPVPFSRCDRPIKPTRRSKAENLGTPALRSRNQRSFRVRAGFAGAAPLMLPGLNQENAAW